MSLKDTYQTLQEFIAPARERLADRTWDYLMGGADTETTLLRNRQALDSLAFRPRVLRDVETVSARAGLFGRDLRLPLILAPIGSLQDIVDGGGRAPARAAAEFGVLHMLSSVCLPEMEEVAGAT
ncbi:MAG: alpha-hydroxy-acid oxidizing protein, partial [Hyphomicrobiales bacterium]